MHTEALDARALVVEDARRTTNGQIVGPFEGFSANYWPMAEECFEAGTKSVRKGTTIRVHSAVWCPW